MNLMMISCDHCYALLTTLIVLVQMMSDFMPTNLELLPLISLCLTLYLVWILFADCSDRVINLKWFSQVLVWSFTFLFNFACLMQF